MSDPFLAEIRIFAGSFAPVGWASCDGQLLSISQNTALFSLLGTTYGGNGTTTFALPNFQGSAPMHQGSGAGLTPRSLGESGGEQHVTLLTSEMPSHQHNLQARPVIGNVFTADPTMAMAKPDPATNLAYQDNTTQNLVPLNPLAVGVAGGSLPHNNMQPYLCLFFIIAMQGIFPPRP
jgi:microcystin-dependent protein